MHSVALVSFRSGIALCIIGDILLRLRSWDLHLLTSTSPYPTLSTIALFISIALSALCLGLGVYPRIASICASILLFFLQTLNPSMYSGEDGLMRILLFFSIVLPTVPYRLWNLRTLRSEADVFYSPWVWVYLFQITAIYFFAGLHKVLDASWFTGKGIQLALATSGATPVAQYLTQYSTLAGILGICVVALQIMVPFVFFGTYRWWAARAALVLVLIVFHSTLALLFSIGVFSLVAIVALIPLIPIAFWKRFSKINDTILNEHTTRTATVTALFIVTLIFWSNIQTFGIGATTAFSRVTNVLGLTQHWTMFTNISPEPFLYTVSAQKQGNEIQIQDPMLTKELSNGKQVNVFRTHRWRRYFLSLRTNPDLALPFMKSICAEEYSSISIQLKRGNEMVWQRSLTCGE